MTNSDMSLSTVIERSLEGEQITEAAPIDVEVEGSTVALSGAVASHLIRDTAERIAQGTPGVSIVINDLVVSQSGDGGRHLYAGNPRATRASWTMSDQTKGALAEPNGDDG
jgi:hypothetical protein